MLTAGSVVAKFKADISELQHGITQVKNSLSGLKNSFSSLGGAVQGIASKSFQFFGNAVSNAMAVAQKMAIVGVGLGAGLVALGKQAVDSAGKFEQYQIAFTTLLKDGKKAQEVIKGIEEDAKKTPFNLPDLIQANQLLISAGEDAEKSRKIIKNLGDAISATGGGNAELQRLGVNLQQIKALGKATALDVRQFAFAGINIYGLLSETTGKTVEQVREMEVTYEDLTTALEKGAGAGGRFENAMLNQSKSLQGIISNTQDVISLTLKDIAIKSGLFDVIKRGVQGFLTLIEANKERVIAFFQGIGTAIQNFINSKLFADFVSRLRDFGRWVEANKDTILTFLKGLAIAFGSLVVIGTIGSLLALLTNPLTLVVLAVALLYTAWTTNFLGIQDITKKVVDFLLKLGKDLEPLFNVLEALFLVWVESFKSFIKIFKVLADKDYKGVWKVITDHIDTVNALLKNKLGVDLPKTFNDGFNNIKKSFDDFGNSIDSWLTSLKNKFKSWQTSVTEDLEYFSKNYEKILTNLFWRLIWAMLDYDAKTLINWGQHLGKLGKQIQDGYERIKLVITTKLTEWTTALQDWFNTLPFYIIVWFIGVTVAINNWFEQQKTVMEQKLEGWRLSLEQWFNNLPNTITVGLSGVTTSIGNWFTSMGERFRVWWENLGKDAGKSLEVGWTSQEPTMAGKIVAGIIAVILLVGATLIIGLVDVGVRGAIALYNALVQGFIFIRNWIITGAKAIVTKAWEGFLGFKDAPLKGLQDMYNGVVSWFDKLLNKVGEYADKIKKAMDKINPFHRESPSLVDYVQMGTSKIAQEYSNLAGGLRNMDFKTPIMDIANGMNIAPNFSAEGNRIINQNIYATLNDKLDVDTLAERLAFKYRNTNL